MNQPLLDVSNLQVEYKVPGFRKAPARVIEDVSFQLQEGETLAIVGESGSGKTTIGKTILGLHEASSGSIVFDGRDITHLPSKERRELAFDIQAVFQNPYGSLNPSLTIGEILSEPLRINGFMSKSDALEKTKGLLSRVGMPEDTVGRYPSNFSGGQRQRIAIARAIARNPRLVVCDEPTSALDVATQAKALELLAELQASLGLAYIFITHDLALVREFADRVLVLDKGRAVEQGEAKRVCDSPQHPYTQKLIASAPVPDPIIQRARRAERLRLFSN
jgi:peptide/nickel transport system ATP-binding protein